MVPFVHSQPPLPGGWREEQLRLQLLNMAINSINQSHARILRGFSVTKLPTPHAHFRLPDKEKGKRRKAPAGRGSIASGRVGTESCHNNIILAGSSIRCSYCVEILCYNEKGDYQSKSV
jgi:hypothetical protein